jgi:hypothetical protein
MLIETHPSGEGEIGTDADEQPAPLTVEQVEVVLLDPPPPGVLEMPAVISANGNEDARRFPRLQDDDDVIGLRPPKVAIDEFIAPLVSGRFDDRRAPGFCASRDPVVVLPGDVLEDGLLTGYSARYRLKKPTTRSGC